MKGGKITAWLIWATFIVLSLADFIYWGFTTQHIAPNAATVAAITTVIMFKDG